MGILNFVEIVNMDIDVNLIRQQIKLKNMSSNVSSNANNNGNKKKRNQYWVLFVYDKDGKIKQYHQNVN